MQLTISNTLQVTCEQEKRRSANGKTQSRKTCKRWDWPGKKQKRQLFSWYITIASECGTVYPLQYRLNQKFKVFYRLKFSGDYLPSAVHASLSVNLFQRRLKSICLDSHECCLVLLWHFSAILALDINTCLLNFTAVCLEVSSSLPLLIWETNGATWWPSVMLSHLHCHTPGTCITIYHLCVCVLVDF